VNLIGVELAEFDEFFDFGYDVVGGGGHHGIEVARGLAIDEVAPAIAFPGFDESKIAADGALKDILAAVEFTSFFSLGNHGAVARRRVKGRNTSASGAQPLRERPLRIQFHLQFPAQNQLFKELVFANIRRDHFLDLPLLEQKADAKIVDPGVVAHDGEVFRAFASNGSDEVFRDAAEPEPAHEYRSAVSKIGDGSVSGSDAFVHESDLAKIKRCTG
jgi:hypothetical protein